MRRVLVLVLACAAQAGSASAADWEPFLDQDGVKGYSRSVPGSEILELRSTTIVPAKIEVVGAVLLGSAGRDHAVDAFLADPARLDRLLGPAGNAEVTAFIARLRASP
jgi:hypothetical protein